MGTSDWPLLRVTSIAQAGGAAPCPTAVAMAADKLLSWMQGSKYTVDPYSKDLDRRLMKKNGKTELIHTFMVTFWETRMSDMFNCTIFQSYGKAFIRGGPV